MSAATPVPRDPLAGELAAIASSARTTLRERGALRAAAAALDGAAFIAGVPALAEIAVRLIGGTPLFGPGWLIAASIIAPVLWLLSQAIPRALARIGDAAALAAVDRALGLGDRLIAAREFLARLERSAFMLAAIEDARPHAAAARARGLPRVPFPPVGRTPLWRAAGAALLVVAALFIAIPPEPPSPDATETATAAGPRLAAREPERGGDADRAPVEPPAPPPRAPRPDERRAGSDEPGAERSGELTEEAKQTLGRTVAGRSSAAAAASGASESKGVPSNQSQASESPPERAKRVTKRPKEAKPGDDTTPPRPRDPEEMSGATAGRGAASGSGKSPSASPWSSKDQVTSDDEEDLEEDEEVDDEFDDSEARGGVQPQLRDRKPPVNRDLAIGFGNQPNPDANGRGGASEQKKSRGVASLVLGVPIPDHVKGRPSPGRTKVTQERVEPEEEESAAATATARTPREDPIGTIAHPDLLPWMRDLVRGYFAAMREPRDDRGQ